jgi:3-hydroxybutyryl-CoA dehydrogenase
MEIRRVAVVGAGVMGRSIATTFARGGFEVAPVTHNPAAVKDIPESVRVTGEPPPTADLVIESMPEWLDPKRDLFHRMGALYGDVAALRRENAGKVRRILEIANE